ncbi:hypothetical protein PSTG_06646 [Puccinia striiformis f. sp. tritici PST-78]|uniref:Uncharacterized protein n=1 Tax=Puccinia striiformis f. sp. tritici PST-78 TaxID=1165861 RepID=A0A0L0VL69_9BASI|nr:hypothetical protein PSTG_06646 [Puccinia striiformis f. sp. tritici PST-78]
MAKLSQPALNSVLLIIFLVGTSSSAPDYSSMSTRGLRIFNSASIAECEKRLHG